MTKQKKLILTIAVSLIVIISCIGILHVNADVEKMKFEYDENIQTIKDIESTQTYLHILANRYRAHFSDDNEFIATLGHKWKELDENKKELQAKNENIRKKMVYLDNFELTAYCITGRTATGTYTTANRTIAVDPKVIPYGQKVYIEGYGVYTAEDCGGVVKGNIIDIYIPGYDNCIKFGRRRADVYLLN